MSTCLKCTICLATVTFILFGTVGSACLKPCPFNWLAFDGHCYRLVTIELTWPEAETYCQRLANLRLGGSHLASIHSEQEQAFIVGLVQASERIEPATAYWLGFNDIASEGSFVWNDGTTGTYTNWSSQQPDNVGGSGNVDCAVLAKYYQWLWDDRGCYAPSFFLCKGKQP
ncbi:echinoidin-like [Patiria miniata]|uniref:C-type lectin domain-containing protein n=1 Tax=Patiria miniata TaxID=46514 RepID=A0A914AFR0_PATMI|nr:echinoidin-like [Patiria miniata]